MKRSWILDLDSEDCFAGVNNYTHYKEWDVITYPFPNFNGCTVKVWGWISKFIPHFVSPSRHAISYPCKVSNPDGTHSLVPNTNKTQNSHKRDWVTATTNINTSCKHHGVKWNATRLYIQQRGQANDQRKRRSSALFSDGTQPVSGGFTKGQYNEESVSTWWRHHKPSFWRPWWIVAEWSLLPSACLW